MNWELQLSLFIPDMDKHIIHNFLSCICIKNISHRTSTQIGEIIIIQNCKGSLIPPVNTINNRFINN